jgi:hypothetical protein
MTMLGFDIPNLNLDIDVPANTTIRYSTWWFNAIISAKGLAERINLAHHPCIWEVWKHRNSCVFEGAQPNIQVLLQIVGNGCTLWCMAGATKLKELWLGG